MECLEAQTKITSYVDGSLSEEECKAFLMHVQKCDGCMEELEIYYTLMEATRQLDEGEITTSNFTEELNQKMRTDLNRIYTNEEWRERGRFGIVVIIIAAIIWLAMKL